MSRYRKLLFRLGEVVRRKQLDAEMDEEIASQLYEAKASDPIILAAGVSGFLAVAFVACWLPALRATKADPMTALRHE